MKKIICTALALLTVGTLPVTAFADGWQDNGTRYEKPDGSYATGLVSINGIKYRFDDQGLLSGRYTGWTSNASTGVKNYYCKGIRRVGWWSVGSDRYYFYYEGGYAVGDVLIEDRIYSFDKNGVYTGAAAEPLVWGQDIYDSFYAEDLPEYINVPFTFHTKNQNCFDVHNYIEEGELEKFSEGKWEKISRNPLPDDMEYGIGPEGYGDVISENPEGEYVNDLARIETARYAGKLTAGKYRAVLTVTYYPDGDNSNNAGSYEGYIYSYFTIE